MNDAHTSTLLVYGMHCSNNEWIWCTLAEKLDIKQKWCMKTKIGWMKRQNGWIANAFKSNYMFIANIGRKRKLVLPLEYWQLQSKKQCMIRYVIK